MGKITNTAIATVNIKRLADNLQRLSAYGKSATGGINRSLASQADQDSRQWIKNYWQQQVGLAVTTDPIANLWGSDPLAHSLALDPIVIGSHNDSVPEGGMYDGALGVLMATEVYQTIRENNIQLRHPLQVISLTGEEPNPYQISTLGSKGLTGIVKGRELTKFKHVVTGETLGVAIDRLGGDAAAVETMALAKDSVAAYLECHIEQGRRLIDRDEPVAIVQKITGIHRELITIAGEANHAGTTALPDRKDALLAASVVDLALQDILIKINDPAVVGTIGYLQVQPNAANIIPGKVQFNIDLRAGEATQVAQVVAKLDGVFAKLIAKGFKVQREVILEQAAVAMDATVVQCFDEVMAQNVGKVINLTSMAGHDAANMVRVGRSGMIFVASVDGKSHCKEEYSKINDIEVAANIMLQTVLKLDKELD